MAGGTPAPKFSVWWGIEIEAAHGGDHFATDSSKSCGLAGLPDRPSTQDDQGDKYYDAQTDQRSKRTVMHQACDDR